MKSVLTGIGLMVVISVVAWFAMGTQSETTGEAQISPNHSVRLDN